MSTRAVVAAPRSTVWCSWTTGPVAPLVSHAVVHNDATTITAAIERMFTRLLLRESTSLILHQAVAYSATLMAGTTATSPSRPLRIVLLSPRGPLYRHRGGIWKKTMRYAPLTLTTLASLVPPEIPVDVRVVDEGIDEILPERIDADLVGISAITGTAPRAYEIAARLRRRSIPVVLGGVHPTLVPDEAARHADSIVVGYAEESWPQLLRDFIAGRMARRYDQSPTLTLENLPFPKRELFDSGMVNVAHTLEATRGCIYQCEFCVVPAAWGPPLQKPLADGIAGHRPMPRT